MNKEVELKELKALLYILENMTSGIDLDISIGICSNVRSMSRHLNILDAWYFEYTFKKFVLENKHSTWYSGDLTYPILDFDKPDIDAARAFTQAYIKGTLWEGTYGDTRRLVLDKYYKYLEKRLKALTRKSLWQRLKDWLRKT